MNIVKNRLHNSMGDQWMNDFLVTYIEKDIFKTIINKKNHAAISRYEDSSMTTELNCELHLYVLKNN
jgi:hypothetical protein